MHTRTWLTAVLATGLSLGGCRPRQESDQGSRAKDVEDIVSMDIIAGTTTFRVVCTYHKPTDLPEIVTADQIRNNQVCKGGTEGGGIVIGANIENDVFTVILNNK